MPGLNKVLKKYAAPYMLDRAPNTAQVLNMAGF